MAFSQTMPYVRQRKRGFHKQGSNLSKHHSARGSFEAKIHTGTQNQSSVKISRDLHPQILFLRLLYLLLLLQIFQGSVASRKRLFPPEACRRCFFCKSVRFCDRCKRCSGCCNFSSCMGQAADVLADLGLYGSQSTGGVHFKEWLHPPVS